MEKGVDMVALLMLACAVAKRFHVSILCIFLGAVLSVKGDGKSDGCKSNANGVLTIATSCFC